MSDDTTTSPAGRETHSEAEPTLSGLLAGPITVGEPDVSGPLAVFPLFGPGARLDYVSFAAAHAAGQVEIGELEGGASVNDLTVTNGSGRPLLLYEGEELLGAQQNRVLDVSLLVAAQTKTRIPVSCVEAGRWDGSRHGERFRPSRQAADPELRKLKQRRVRERLASGAAPAQARPDQGEVWNEVSARQHTFGAESATSAMHDVYEARRDHLAELREPIRLHEGQCGAVCAIGGEVSILDFVGRPDVWADLHPALLEGYALDALRIAGGGGRADAILPFGPPDLGTVRGLTLLIGDVPAERRDRVAGIGDTARFATAGIAGSALIGYGAGEPHEGPEAPVGTGGAGAGAAGGPPSAGELVQLTAYPETDGPSGPARPGGPGAAARRRTRVRRPSRRRRS